MRRKLISPVLIFIMVLFISSCSRADNVPVGGEGTEGKINKPLFRSADFSAKKLYPEALKIAKKWRSDAELYGVTAVYRIDKGSPAPSSISFDFASSDIKQGGLTVDSFGKGWDSRFEESLSLIDIYRPIDMNELKIDISEALEIAEKSGGADLREKRQPDTIGLDLGKTQNFIWSAEYGYGDRPEDGKHFLIDGISGTLTGVI